MSALNEVLDIDSRMFPAATRDARAELAQLRADLQAAQERSAEQARKLDEARKLEAAIRAVHDIEIELTACPVCNYSPISCECAYTEVRAWLAANPAPQVDDQDAADRFNDWRKEHEEDLSRRIEAAS